MKIILSIGIFACILLYGCNLKTEKVSEQNESIKRNSNNLKVNKIETTKPINKDLVSIAKSFYTVYVEDTIMIFDSIGLGLNCYLINVNEQSVMKAKTSDHKLYWTEIFEKKVTTTEATDTSKFQLAFVGDTAKIDWIKKTQIVNDNIKKSILSSLNISNYAGLFENYGGPISIYAEKLKANPKIESIVFNDKTLYLITYRLESYPNYIVNGPSFLMSKSDNKVYPLTGPCSDSDSNVFILNGKLYIYTGSNCCDCGIVVDQLYEFDGFEIEQIIEDGSWST